MAARRTTMNIDHDLVAQAQAVLGADTATATVHQALADVIRRFHLERLMSRDFGGLPEQELRSMRRPRSETREWGHSDEDAPERDAS